MKPEIKNMLKSDKYIMPEAKIKEYLLKPGEKHAEEFFDAGYTVGDIERLNRDIDRQFDKEKAVEFCQYENGDVDFNIYMDLGVGRKRKFKTVWRTESTPASKPGFITAYRVKEGKGDV